MVRADTQWLAAVIERVEAYPQVLEHLTVMFTNLAVRRGDRWWGPSGPDRVSIRDTRAVRAAEAQASADLAASSVQGLSDGALFSIIQNGVRWTGMPAWKGEHSEEDSWRLVSFVRRVPSLTADDLETLRHDQEHHSDRGESDGAHRHEHGDPRHPRP